MRSRRALDLGGAPPDAWRSSRLKDVAFHVNRGISPKYSDTETGVVAFSQKCIRNDLSVALELGRPMLCELPPAVGDARLRAGDVVVNSTGRGTLGRASMIAAEPPATLVADGHVTVIRVDPSSAHPGFLRWMLGTRAFFEQANECLAVGATNQTELNREALRTMRIAVPSLAEQVRISQYLDCETDQVDGLISEQECLAQLLKERRSAAVFDAVTGRSSSGQRRAGLPWVESIPARWGATKLTAVARLGSGHTPPSSRRWVEGVM